MPKRRLAATELGELFKCLAHPERILMVEELRHGECDVSSLAAALGLAGPRTSQHLAILKAHKVVAERREGRFHYYHLVQPDLAKWIVDGLDFIESLNQTGLAPADIERVRDLWASDH